MGSKSTIDWSNEYLTFEALESGTFQFTNACEYSLNGGAWTSLAAATNTPTLAQGDTIRWRATITPTSSNGIGTFSSSGRYNAVGNPLSIGNGNNFKTSTIREYQFYMLFKNSTKLINANFLVLPTVSTQSCCREMFNGCTNLTTAPKLPATTLASNCYRSMFLYCTSLTIIPALPATTLADSCYQYMFENCRMNLNGSLVLPASVIYSNSYNRMLTNCSSINYIKALATSFNTGMNGFTSGVAKNGTFVKHPDATWSIGSSGIPSGWTILEAVDITIAYTAGNSGAYLKETGSSDVMHNFIDGETYEGEFDDAKTYEIYDANDNLIQTLVTPFSRTVDIII